MIIPFEAQFRSLHYQLSFEYSLKPRMLLFALLKTIFGKTLSFNESLLIAITVIVFGMLVILRHFEKPTAVK